MSQFNSWEEAQDADENLSQQAQRNLNIGGGQSNTFTPGASTFTPGAASFQPGASSFQPGAQSYQHNQYPQYGGGYGNYQQGGYPQYQQYGQGGYQQQGYQGGYQQGGYGQQYAQQGGYQQQGGHAQQAPTPAAQAPAPTPAAAQAPAAAPAAAPAPAAAAAPPKAKVLTLSLGGDSTPKKTEAPKKEAKEEKPAAAAKADAPKKETKAAAKAETAGKPAADKTAGAPSSAAVAKAQKKEADAVEKEQAADVDEELLKEMYGKEHVNVIFLGHVDAGKSTLGGSILYATGMVDERTMDKLKREAKEAGRETWYLSWALDLTKEERREGKTVEVGRGFFETEKRRYSILDAPGHKTFVPSMIGGASQADVGILVISSRKGEYETGFERGGQTREHAMLAKTQGVNKLVIAVNKMDDPTVEWSEDRFKECTTKLGAFLKGLGYSPKTDLTFMPLSAQTGKGIKDRVPKDLCPWYDGPSLLEYLDNMKALERKVLAPFMMPIAAKYKDLGVMIEGKIEAGVLKKENNYLMMPNREKVSISALFGETEDEIAHATCGEQVRMRIRGVEEEDISPGFVLCNPTRPVNCVQAFEAQIVLLDIRSILSAGFNCVLHVHSAQEEVTFAALLHKLEKGTNRKSKKAPGFATKGMSIIARLEVISGARHICVERFADYPQLGRFTLRDQGQTIAIGKVTKLIQDVNEAS